MEELRRAVENIAQDLESLAGNYIAMDEYFEDALDIEYRVDAQGRYRSVRLMVACGGHNIFVDTKVNEVQGYWGASQEAFPISSDVAGLIDTVFEENWGDAR